MASYEDLNDDLPSFPQQVNDSYAMSVWSLRAVTLPKAHEGACLSAKRRGRHSMTFSVCFSITGCQVCE